MYLVLDTETRSEADLKALGAEGYARHPSTELLCLAGEYHDGERFTWTPDKLFPRRLLAHVHDGLPVIAHNAIFDFNIWNWCIVDQLNRLWPELRIEQMRCTMARAYAQGLPGSVDKLAQALKLADGKDLAGAALMRKMCKPLKAWRDSGTGPKWHESPADLKRLVEYCAADVSVEHQIHKILLPLSDAEQKLWELDARINSRGVCIDVDSARRAIAVAEAVREDASDAIRAATGGAVDSVSASVALRDWVESQGFDVDSVAKDRVTKLLEKDLTGKDVLREVLELRKEAAKASTAKYKAMVAGVCDDGRARGLHQYHGAASTGRWAGRRIQPQNLPRYPKGFDSADADYVHWLLRRYGAAAAGMLRLNYASPLDALSWSLRSFIRAADGRDLVAADLSNIEGRAAAWLADEQWKLQAFRDYDAGTGPDLYVLAYSKSFGVDVLDVHDDERQIGKVQELALQFGGGLGAFKSAAVNYGIHVVADRSLAPPGAKQVLTEADAEHIKQGWREAHPHVVSMWYALERAAKEATRNPGAIQHVGRIKYVRHGNFLFCRLPSGRCISYAYPVVETVDDARFGRMEKLIYMGTKSGKQYGGSNKWTRVETYGGKLFENVVQATARDVLADALINLEAAGYQVVMHVHDEAVAEVISGPVDLKNFEACFRPGVWADGMPVTAKAWRGKRYRK